MEFERFIPFLFILAELRHFYLIHDLPKTDIIIYYNITILVVLIEPYSERIRTLV